MAKHHQVYVCYEPGCEKLKGFTYSSGLLQHQREVHRQSGNSSLAPAMGGGYTGMHPDILSPAYDPSRSSWPINPVASSIYMVGPDHGPASSLRFCPHKECKRSTDLGFTRKETLNEHLRRVHHGIGIIPDKLNYPGESSGKDPR